MEQDALVVVCVEISGGSRQHPIKHFQCFVKLFYAAQSHRVAHLELLILRFQPEDGFEFPFGRGEVFEVEAHRGEILASIGIVRICRGCHLEHGECGLDVIPLEMDQPQEIQDRGVVPVDAQCALADQFSDVILPFPEQRYGQVQVGVHIVGVTQEGDAAVLDGLVEIAIVECFSRIVVPSRRAVLVKGDRLLEKFFCLLRLAAQGREDTELGHGFGELLVYCQGIPEELLGLAPIIESEVEDAQVVDGFGHGIRSGTQFQERLFCGGPWFELGRVFVQVGQCLRQFRLGTGGRSRLCHGHFHSGSRCSNFTDGWFRSGFDGRFAWRRLRCGLGQQRR